MTALDEAEHGRAIEQAAATAPRGPLARRRSRRPGWTDRGHADRFFTAAALRARDAPPAAAHAATWLLDNLYVVRRVVAALPGDMPVRFWRRLPGVAGRDPAVPRILDLADAFLGATGLQVSPTLLERFLDHYQPEQPLTTAELWALPTALRIACLDQLAHALEKLFPDLPAPPRPLRPVEPARADPADVVAGSLQALGTCAKLSWEELFDRVSPVERVLARDPAGVYPRMDFSTRDRYRRAVEKLADWSGRSEPTVAEAALALATAHAGDERAGHVGYWLIGTGRPVLERRIGVQLPLGARWERWLEGHAFPAYLAALIAATGMALMPPGLLLAAGGASLGSWVVGLAVSLVPASLVGLSFVHWLLTHLVRPRLLPRLDFRRGLAEGCETAVVVPVLVDAPDDAASLARALEAHHLANRDPRIRIVLLSDFADAPTAERPEDPAIEAALVEAVRALNRRHGRGDEDGPFHLLHRRRSWCATQRAFLGRERKRGKIEDFCRLVRDGALDAFPVRVGALAHLRRCRFAMIADADTRLPLGTVARLVGTAAHPLNRPVHDTRTGKVVAGYAVLQPRIEPAPGSAATLYGRLQAGDTSIDIYARAVSDVYQDLFGEGIFAGKGLIDIEAFQRSLADRMPEERILSHDLLEGLHARCALVSDVVIFESFPDSHAEQQARVHRWTRGDWQLLPWLAAQVPGARGPVPSVLSPLDRLKLLDNLRRSLVAPSLVAMAAAGWLLLPGPAWGWSLLAALALGLSMALDLLASMARGRTVGGARQLLRRCGEGFGRFALSVAFLAADALSALDAVGRTLVRLRTRRRLLEWRTAAQVRQSLLARSPARAQLVALAPGTALGLGLLTLVASLKPASLPAALLLGVPWLAAPLVAAATSRVLRPRAIRLAGDDIAFLRGVARRTWLYFETFAGPSHHWLPPDNFQEAGLGVEAPRTSPTNVGMMFLAMLAAQRLGHLSVPALAERTALALDALDRAPAYRGHVLNWIDTRTLEPLEPRYVSTVDSGNLAMSLLALAGGLEALRQEPAVGVERLDGLADTLRVLEEALTAPGARAPAALVQAAEEARSLREALAEVRTEPRRWPGFAAALRERGVAALANRVADALADWPDPDPRTLADVEAWIERTVAHADELARDLASFPPMDTLAQGLPAELAKRLRSARGLAAQADALVQAAEDVERRSAPGCPDAARLRAAAATALELDQQLCALASRARARAAAIDFGFLFDPATRLFRIGLNLSTGEPDAGLYDLLASEARLASFLAIARGAAPPEHWAHLGRPVTRVDGRLVLVSWQGSMFEYLMPRLLLKAPEGSLLAEAERSAVLVQQAHARRLGLPWGVSESGYAARDAQGHYQYQGFGVPRLGIRRGLEADRVVAPYATLLALPVDPTGAVANLRRLAGLGLLRRYGFVEAADFTPTRLPAGWSFVAVEEYMAHHQGMGLAALANLLFDDWLVELVRADPELATADLLLAERCPWDARPDPSGPPPAPVETRPAATVAHHPWPAEVDPGVPALHAAGNGRLVQRIASRGGVQLFHEERLLARTPGAGTGADARLPLFVRDGATGTVWRPGDRSGPAGGTGWQARFAVHGALFRDRALELGIRVETGVAPDADLECLKFVLTNESARSRTLDLLFVREVVLDRAADHERHPAFSRLFVETAWLADRQALLARRRPRRPEERPPVMLVRMVCDEPGFTLVGHQTDRARLFPPPGDPDRPDFGALDATSPRGFSLDPVVALAGRLELPPGKRVEVAVLTAVGSTQADAEAVLDRFQTAAAVEWALRAAESAARAELDRLGFRPGEAEALQRLLTRLLGPTALPALDPGDGPGQSDLWAAGISGDHPVLAVKSDDGTVTPCLEALLRFHRRWRSLGVRIDLVILHGGEPGYVEPVRDRLLRQLKAQGLIDALGHRGGIHLVPLAMPALVRAVEAASLVTLDAAGDLSPAALGPPARLPELPVFPATGTLPEAARPAPPPPVPLASANGHGGFDPATGDYVIQGEAPPVPWANVIAFEEFGTLVDHRSLGFTWALNAGEFRLTPWRNDPVFAPPAEALHLRDEVTARIWNAVPEPGVGWVRHRPGLSTFVRHDQGLDQTVEVGVARDAPVKIVRLRLSNRTTVPRRITATYQAEWLLGPVAGETRAWLQASYDPPSGAILAQNRRVADFARHVAFLASDRPPHGLSASRLAFLGPDGDPRRPEALARWGLGTVWASRGDALGALQVHLDLPPGGEAEALFLLGAAPSAEEARALVQRFRQPGVATAALARATRWWDELLSAVEVETPDPAFDRMVNRWLPLQSAAARLFARAGPWQASGAFGFRDQLQDVLALLWHDPALARAHLLRAAAHQFEEGDVLHWWHPPGGQGVRTRCSDDLLWLPFAAARYVEATGDLTILDEPVPFLKGEPLRPDEAERYATWARGEEAPLLEHLARALAAGWRLGPDGLPLIGTGDWNDGLDRVGARGRGTSVWLGWFLIAVIDGFVRLAERAGRPDLAQPWPARREALRQALEARAWDGQWYARAFDDEGAPWGSHLNEECRIDLIAQAWAVLSGAADPNRARQAMDCARTLLAGADGLVRLLAPPFQRTRRDPGYIAAYPPGIRENGGQYAHAAAWFGLALARLGDGDGAKDVFDRINPILRTQDAAAVARYRGEPYACAADIAGAPPHTGRCGWTWYTGAAGWAFRLAIEGILGLRLVDGALVVLPCLPRDWSGADVRVQRGAGAIRVRIHGGGAGPWRLRSAGREVDGPVAFPATGETVIDVVPAGVPVAPSPDLPAELAD